MEKKEKEVRDGEEAHGSRVCTSLRAVSEISKKPAGNDNKNNHFTKLWIQTLSRPYTRYRDAVMTPNYFPPLCTETLLDFEQ